MEANHAPIASYQGALTTVSMAPLESDGSKNETPVDMDKRSLHVNPLKCAAVAAGLGMTILLCFILVSRNSHATSGILPSSDIAFGSIVSDRSAYPFAVDISVRTSYGSSVCTGVIVASSWVLTAAHCAEGATSMAITAGSIVRTPRTNGAQVRKSKRFVFHDSAKLFNLAKKRDVVLVELSSPFDFSDSGVQPIRISAISPPIGTQLVAIGWGTLGKRDHTNNLREATMNVRSSTDCTTSPFEICTQGGSGNTCGGDSGGPLVWKFDDGSIELVGLNSYSSTSCANLASNVDIFELAPAYRFWVAKTASLKQTFGEVLTTKSSCTTACSTIGMEALMTGRVNGKELLVCAANTYGIGYRAGYQIGGGNSCQVGGGGTQVSESTYKCFCGTASWLGFAPDLTGKSCNQVCKNYKMKPMRLGVYTKTGASMYACGVTQDGLRAGFNLLSSGHQMDCIIGYGGKQVNAKKFKCICHH